jgi:non-haem Fe2+, alpha-ketoglutarate-dependent halogenase
MNSLEYSLTEEQISLYREQGFLGPLTLCSSEEMTGICEKILKVMETVGIVPDTQQGGRLASLLSKNGRIPTPYIECRHLDSRVVYDLCTHPLILHKAISIYGPDLTIWRSTLIDKFPGSPEFRWHQDYGGVYSRGNEYGLEPPLHFTAYIALTDMTVENGCLSLIPGIKAVLPSIPASSDLNSTQIVAPDCIDSKKAINMELKAGEFCLFTDRALHYSYPNNSTSHRRALVVRLTLPIVKVRPHFKGHKVVLVSGKDSLGINPIGGPPTL